MFAGSILKLRLPSFEKEGEGLLRFNETAGSMAKDSIRCRYPQDNGKRIGKLDLHVNVVGVPGLTALCRLCHHGGYDSAITQNPLYNL